MPGPELILRPQFSRVRRDEARYTLGRRAKSQATSRAEHLEFIDRLDTQAPAAHRAFDADLRGELGQRGVGSYCSRPVDAAVLPSPTS